MTTESVQDIVGSMIAGAGGTYNDAAGTIALPTPEGTRGLVITDTNVATIPAGDATDNIAAYYNSGASPITVQGTRIAAGSHAVWAWVSGAWVLLASGTSAPATPATPGAPTVTIDSVTATSVAVNYSTTDAGVTGWRYRLNGGAWSALDGTSPDTITGLNPSTTYAIDVQYTVDGTAWSPMASTITTTAQSAVSYMRLSTVNATNYPLKETGDATTGYTYGLLWGAYQGFPAWTSTKTCPASGDFTVDVTIGEVRAALVRASDSAKDSIIFRMGTFTVTYIMFGTPRAGRPEPTGADWYYTGMDNMNVANTNTLPAIQHAPGDILRVGRTGTELWTKVSKDGGATWIDLYLKPGVTPTATKFGIMGGGSAPWAAPVVITKPTYTGAWT